MQLVKDFFAGNKRSLSRLITMIENNDPSKFEILKSIYPYTGNSYIVGITGSPGAGKSTLVDCILHKAQQENIKVGVIAIDPTSPFTGGAILGDRIRMQNSFNEDIYVRSMATRGSLGGISQVTRETIHVLDAFGKDLIIVETVGVGQSEIDIVKTADTTIVVLTPAGGDSIQMIKAGIMEIADIFVVNKSDLPGADRTVSNINNMVELNHNNSWHTPVVSTVAMQSKGIDDLWNSISEHRQYNESSERLPEIRKQRIQVELMEQIEYIVKSKISDILDNQIHLDKICDKILSRQQDPYSAALELLKEVDFPV